MRALAKQSSKSKHRKTGLPRQTKTSSIVVPNKFKLILLSSWIADKFRGIFYSQDIKSDVFQELTILACSLRFGQILNSKGAFLAMTQKTIKLFFNCTKHFASFVSAILLSFFFCFTFCCCNNSILPFYSDFKLRLMSRTIHCNCSIHR